MKNRISIDTETLGTSHGSVICQIAAYNIDTEASTTIYVDIADCAREGLLRDQSTLDWWKKQDPQIYLKVTSGKISLKDSLRALTNWIHQQSTETPEEVWMNSPSFDSAKILEPAYAVFGWQLPWGFRAERDFRTLRALSPLRLYTPPLGAHDALVDAIAQGKFVKEILG